MRLCAAVSAALFTAACGNGVPVRPGAPTTLPATTTYEGSWTGQTNQTKRLKFSVIGDRVTQLEFDFDATGSGSPCFVTGGFGGGGNFGTISDGAFTLRSPASVGTLTWSVTGTFGSPTTATGTMDVSVVPIPLDNPSGCSVSLRTTWSAQKQP